MKYVIGLTGNIATGKSTVLRILKGLGAHVIDADRVTRMVMRRGEPAYADILAAFGAAILQADGEIDRRALGERVFSDPAALRKLEQIVHPATIQRISQEIERSTSKVIVVEAIKLIESGMVARFADALWVVYSPREQQLSRLMQSRGMSRQEALRRIEAQPPQKEKIKVADVVITNAGSLEDLRERVEVAWRTVPERFRLGDGQREAEA